MQTHNIELSGHAEWRCQQRGISSEVVQTIVAHADLVLPAHGGGEALMITDAGRARMREEGIHRVCEIERLADVVVVLAADGTIVTAMHHDGRRRRTDQPRRLWHLRHRLNGHHQQGRR